jgi:hypothetical protein
MNVFMYCAALLCGDCGEKAVENCVDRSIVDNGDPDTYPQGPYPEGGGEADTPNHCDDCDVFLENSLTEDGQAYVRESYAWERETTNPSKSRNAIENTQRWANYYDYLDLPGQSYVVWFGYSGQLPFAVGAELFCKVFADLESAQRRAHKTARTMQPGDVLEIVDCNPE